MKYVFIFVESDLRGRFFYRFKSALLKKSYKPVVITDCPTVWIKAKKNGDIAYLLRNGSGKQDSPMPLAEEVLEIKTGELSIDAANILGNYWCERIKLISQEYPPSLCMIYNGTTLLPYVAKWWASHHGIKSLFFELANIPGKMFVDRQGTNAKSYLYAHPEILDKYEVDDDAYAEWKKNYLEKKSVVKQAAFSSQILSVLLFAVNHLYFAALIPGIKNKFFYLKKWTHKFSKRYTSKKKTVSNAASALPADTSYYLFPMQVTADSQVLLNSTVSLLEAVGIAVKKSEEAGVKLIIKPHPAELDKTIYPRIREIYPQAIVMNGDIKKMIEKADKIITINSTAGLESILSGKQVEFLGKSFYKYFTQDDELLRKYIMGYLVNIDYFGTDEVTEACLEQCLQK
ncbi:MAG: hypothetical protein ACFWTM_04045 [Mitsuokella multacida]|jgi:capsular polysaccharide export protein